jgi:hypothetical protein
MESLHTLDFFRFWLWADNAWKLSRYLFRCEEEAKIVMFGIFQPQRISMVLDPADTYGPRTILEPYHYEADSGSSLPAIHLGFDALHSSAHYPRQAVRAYGSETPVVSRYPLTSFSFLLARDFRIRLVDNGESGPYWAPF